MRTPAPTRLPRPRLFLSLIVRIPMPVPMPLLAHAPLRILASAKPAQQYPRCGPQAGENGIADKRAGAGAEERVAVFALFLRSVVAPVVAVVLPWQVAVAVAALVSAVPVPPAG